MPQHRLPVAAFGWMRLLTLEFAPPGAVAGRGQWLSLQTKPHRDVDIDTDVEAAAAAAAALIAAAAALIAAAGNLVELGFRQFHRFTKDLVHFSSPLCETRSAL